MLFASNGLKWGESTVVMEENGTHGQWVGIGYMEGGRKNTRRGYGG